MTQKIGIIGAGNIGRGLATHLSKTDHEVMITNTRGVDSLKDLVLSIGGSLIAAEFKETLEQSDVLFIAVPWVNVPDVAKELAMYKDKLIIDATNNIVSVAPFQLADLSGRSTGEYISLLFPTHRVVKAFNTLGAAILALPQKSTRGNTVIFLSGDNTEAKKQTAEIAIAMGFAPIDIGTFKEGGKLQDVGGALSGLELLKVLR
jgi:predicted dinucleotide-binding enzyme